MPFTVTKTTTRPATTCPSSRTAPISIPRLRPRSPTSAMPCARIRPYWSRCRPGIRSNVDRLTTCPGSIVQMPRTAFRPPTAVTWARSPARPAPTTSPTASSSTPPRRGPDHENPAPISTPGTVDKRASPGCCPSPSRTTSPFRRIAHCTALWFPATQTGLPRSSRARAGADGPRVLRQAGQGQYLPRHRQRNGHAGSR